MLNFIGSEEQNNILDKLFFFKEIKENLWCKPSEWKPVVVS